MSVSNRLLADPSLFGLVLETLPVGVWIMNAEGEIVQGNPAGLSIWQGARYVGPDEFSQYKGWWADTGRPIAADEWAAARAISHGETAIEQVVDIECFDGTRKTILNSALPIRDADGATVGAIIVNQDITEHRRLMREREELILSLERALAEVRTLSGLLPICSSCKRIRDDQGSWQRVEKYIKDHTDAEFSHGICTECLRSMYPDHATAIEAGCD